MNRLTYEILAKWVAETHNITVEFSNQGGPCANPKENKITLPYDVKENNVFSILAWLIHEAAHIKSSRFPDDLSSGPISHDILNAIEDIRIDLKNFDLLPNIREFYERMIKDHVYPKAGEFNKEPLLNRILTNLILKHESFDPIPDTETEKIIDYELRSLIDAAIYALNFKNWDTVKKTIKEIMVKLNLQENQQQQQQQGQQQGQQEQQQQGQGQQQGQQEQQQQGQQQGQQEQIEKFLHPSSMWDKGEDLRGISSTLISPASLQEITKEKFKELLNVKEKKIDNDGNKLDTDNLVDFFTGNIESLFKEENTIKTKKTKIIFLLDASGSMYGLLLDRTNRKFALKSVTKAIIQILDEVRKTEGLDVTYEIHAFTKHLHLLTQNNWEKEYDKISGGTRIVEPFTMLQIHLEKEKEIDKQIIIIITDGHVHPTEIEIVQKDIQKCSDDTRVAFIFIGGSNKENNNILTLESADQVIMNVISQMLE